MLSLVPTIAYGLLLAGLVFVIVEAIIPGANSIVVGIAMLIGGIFGVITPFENSPLILSIVVLFAGGLVFYVYDSYDIYGDDGKQTTDSSSYEGSIGTVTEPIPENGYGKVKLRDSDGFRDVFHAKSEFGSIEEGAEVIVVDGGGGNILTVEKISE